MINPVESQTFFSTARSLLVVGNRSVSSLLHLMRAIACTHQHMRYWFAAYEKEHMPFLFVRPF